MNFQHLSRIENADHFIDMGFSAGKRAADRVRAKKYRSRLSKSRAIERERVVTVGKVLIQQFDAILESFPRLDELPDFYKELVKITADYAALKKALGSMLWAKNQVRKFTRLYKGKVGGSKQIGMMNAHRRAFYGRMASVCKQISPQLELLEQARKAMRKYPAIKTSLPTVCIYGFPNVGKTTLLFRLTGSRPEISNYAFTTKSINIGYLTVGKKQIQMVDTPGTLNRFDAMNSIEMQAALVLRMLAEKIVYVFDPTESSFPLREQEKLLKRVRKEKGKKKLLVYIAKSDMMKPDDFRNFAARHRAVTSIDELIAALSV